MSNKIHCDVCDSIVSRRGGELKFHPLFGLGGNDKDAQFCLTHYNEFARVIQKWFTVAQGGFVSPAEWNACLDTLSESRNERQNS